MKTLAALLALLLAGCESPAGPEPTIPVSFQLDKACDLFGTFVFYADGAAMGAEDLAPGETSGALLIARPTTELKVVLIPLGVEWGPFTVDLREPKAFLVRLVCA